MKVCTLVHVRLGSYELPLSRFNQNMNTCRNLLLVADLISVLRVPDLKLKTVSLRSLFNEKYCSFFILHSIKFLIVI